MHPLPAPDGSTTNTGFCDPRAPLQPARSPASASVVARTWPGKGDYSYYVQRPADFIAWLDRPRTKNIRRMRLKAKKTDKHGL